MVVGLTNLNDISLHVPWVFNFLLEPVFDCLIHFNGLFYALYVTRNLLLCNQYIYFGYVH